MLPLYYFHYLLSVLHRIWLSLIHFHCSGRRFTRKGRQHLGIEPGTFSLLDRRANCHTMVASQWGPTISYCEQMLKCLKVLPHPYNSALSQHCAQICSLHSSVCACWISLQTFWAQTYEQHVKTERTHWLCPSSGKVAACQSVSGACQEMPCLPTQWCQTLHLVHHPLISQHSHTKPLKHSLLEPLSLQWTTAQFNRETFEELH